MKRQKLSSFEWHEQFESGVRFLYDWGKAHLIKTLLKSYIFEIFLLDDNILNYLKQKYDFQ